MGILREYQRRLEAELGPYSCSLCGRESLSGTPCCRGAVLQPGVKSFRQDAVPFEDVWYVMVLDPETGAISFEVPNEPEQNLED